MKFTKSRSKKFYFTIVLPISVSVIIGIFIVILNANSVLHTRAAKIAADERDKMNSEIARMNKEEKELTRDEAKYDEIIQNNKSVSDSINAMQSELDELNDNITLANTAKTELESSLASKKAYIENRSTTTENKGSEYAFKDTDVKCPADIPAGKYTASGSGVLYLKTIANSEKDRQDLSTLDTNSYTFTIASGESINIKGSVTLTQINN